MGSKLLFIEPLFLFVLLPVAVALFYVAGNFSRRTLPLLVIVAASAIFYAPYGAFPGALLAASLGINLVIGVELATSPDVESHRARVLLFTGLAFNFGALAAFKYLNQLWAMVSPTAAPLIAIGIPAGISFYTFHQAVFLSHAYRRQPEVVKFVSDADGVAGKFRLFVRYAAFVAFFPQLIIGPITYLSEIAPQIWAMGFGRWRNTDIQVGATLVTVGLFKKLCIADSIARTINPVYDTVLAGTAISQQQAILAIVGYTFQLYFDFSGYSDIALGIARLFGFRLPINFDSPLQASGIIDFWRRWHITLTRIVVLYVFTPLSLRGTRLAVNLGCSGWRKRALSAWIPYLVNFQIITLWHAAKYTFIVYGLINGVWFILESEVRATRAFKNFRSRTSERSRKISGMLVTAVPMMLAFAVFRSDSLTQFWHLLISAAGFASGPVDGSGYVNRREWVRLAAVAIVVYGMPNTYELLKNYRPGLRIYANPPTGAALARVAWRPTLVWGAALSALAAIAFLNINVPTRFLYAAF